MIVLLLLLFSSPTVPAGLGVRDLSDLQGTAIKRGEF